MSKNKHKNSFEIPNLDAKASKNIEREAEKFLTSSGSNKIDIAIDSINHYFKDRSMAKKVFMLTVAKLLREYNPATTDKKNSIFVTSNILGEQLKKISAEEFLKREWKYVPFLLKNKEYERLRLAQFPIKKIHMIGYDYSAPVYQFVNNVNDHYSGRDYRFNDVQFYLSGQTPTQPSSIYAKFIDLKYTIVNGTLVDEAKARLNKEESDKAIYDNVAYDRRFSIVMHSLLNGDPNKSVCYFRYDSGNYKHTNIFMKGDYRREVFGSVAQNPHLHFHNEDDAIFCLKQQGWKAKRIKAGRCNSIDIPHLKKYLLKLDKASDEEVARMQEKGRHYNMPFLFQRINANSANRELPYKFDIDIIIDGFAKNLNDNDCKFLYSKFNEFKEKTAVAQGPLFSNLIYYLDFIQFIYDERIALSNDYSSLCKKEVLSNLEIEVVNIFVDKVLSLDNEFAKYKDKLYHVKKYNNDPDDIEKGE